MRSAIAIVIYLLVVLILESSHAMLWPFDILSDVRKTDIFYPDILSR